VSGCMKHILSKLMHWYGTHYKVLTILPFILLLCGIGQLTYQSFTTGDFVSRGISLSGGTTITIQTTQPVLISSLEQSLSSFAGSSQQIVVRELTDFGTQTGIIIETSISDSQAIQELLKVVESTTGPIQKELLSVETTGPQLGEEFFTQMKWGLFFAFALMGVVVFIAFKSLVPSLAIVVSAFTDLVLTIAVFNILGGQLSTSGVAALLLVIGYSVDTNVLLTNHMLKRTTHAISERINSAWVTGWAMILTTIVAVVAGLLMTNASAIREIMLILLIGLVIDTITTWFQNAGLLRWYLEKHGGAQ
jgi:preprotein translocase subunit SecF